MTNKEKINLIMNQDTKDTIKKVNGYVFKCILKCVGVLILFNLAITLVTQLLLKQ